LQSLDNDHDVRETTPNHTLFIKHSYLSYNVFNLTVLTNIDMGLYFKQRVSCAMSLGVDHCSKYNKKNKSNYSSKRFIAIFGNPVTWNCQYMNIN